MFWMGPTKAQMSAWIPVEVDEMTTEELILTYPRSRAPLSYKVAEIFDSEYRDNLKGKRMTQAMSKNLESWMHRAVASGFRRGATLELGAGTLNHPAYEQGHEAYDIVEPRSYLYEDSIYLPKVRQSFNDISEIPRGSTYDRIISIAVLEHVTNLPDYIARCGLLLRPDGLMQAGIPSEGGLLWGLAWRLSTGLAFRLRTGCDYGEIMRHEHVSTVDEILQLVRFFFEQVTITRFPLPFKHLSLYTYLSARSPVHSRCGKYLTNNNGPAIG